MMTRGLRVDHSVVLFLLILGVSCLPEHSQAQRLTISPHSMSFWGKTPHIGEFSIEYKRVGIHYFHTYTNQTFEYKGDTVHVKSSPAISFTPIIHREWLRAGVMLTPKRFPIDTASYYNFLIDVGFKVRSIRFSYRHVSNGVGGFGTYRFFPNTNPGVDFFSITLLL